MECFENKVVSSLQQELQLKNIKQIKDLLGILVPLKEVVIMKTKTKNNDAVCEGGGERGNRKSGKYPS